jgi:hypothetical protein
VLKCPNISIQIDITKEFATDCGDDRDECDRGHDHLGMRSVNVSLFFLFSLCVVRSVFAEGVM